MSTSPTAIIDELRATLWRTAGPATRARADDLDVLLTRLAVGRDTPGDELLARAIALAHAIAGSAGIFGVRGAAQPASELERVLRASRDGERIVLDDARGLLARAVAALDESLEEAS